MLARTRALKLLLTVVLAVGVWIGSTAAAMAVPPADTLGISGLRELLADSPDGTVDGYFKTVLKDQKIEEIEVKILGTTAGDSPGTSFILFESSDPAIVKFGGVVAGMSGSPIYVEHEGSDKIVGAVSYGDNFTLNGTGLATPIESMLALKDRYSAVLRMSDPVIADGRMIDRVIITPEPEKYTGARAAGALVAQPLNTVFIGGLRPGSKAYKNLAKSFAEKGLAVANNVQLASSGLPAASMVPTDLVPGAAVASLAARGDLWAGGIGTVTYAQDGEVLAFGHPDNWDGETSLYMMNAWIDGVWPSAKRPYKLGSPTALRGTIVQDRFAGILGHLDEMPAETTVTARVTNVDTGETTTSATYIPSLQLNTGRQSGYLVAAALSTPLQALVDLNQISGSAHTTTTVTVSDGTTVYDVVMPNFYDSANVDWSATWDAWSVLDALQYVLDSGTETLDIRSVNMEMDYSAQRKRATVAAVDVPGGLRSGANTATVTYVVYGQSDFVTQSVPFTLPTDTPLVGSLSVGPSSGYGYYSYYPGYYYNYYGSYSTTSGPFSDWVTSVKEVVDELSLMSPNNSLSLVFRPRMQSSSPATEPLVIETSATTPWYLQSYARISSPRVYAETYPVPVGYRGYALLDGMITGPEKDSALSIYATPAGSTTESLLSTATATYDAKRDVARFGEIVGGFTTNQTLRIRCEPTEGWLSADTTLTLPVQPSMSLAASKRVLNSGQRLTLAATVRPSANAGAKVAFQAYSGGSWKTIATKTLVVSGSTAKASYSWKPSKRLRKVRVKFLGSATNAAKTSSSVSITVK